MSVEINLYLKNRINMLTFGVLIFVMTPNPVMIWFDLEMKLTSSVQAV